MKTSSKKIKSNKRTSARTSSPGFKSQRTQSHISKTKANSDESSISATKSRKTLKSTNWRRNINLNNVTLEKKKQADIEIEARNKKRRKAVRKRRRLKAYVLSIIIILGYLATIKISNTRNQVEVDIQQLGEEYSTSDYVKGLKSGAVSQFNSGWGSKFKHPNWRSSHFIDSYMDSNPEINSIDYKFNWVRMQSSMSIKLSVPLVSWVSPGGDKISYVNQKGQIFDPPPELVKLFQPLSIKGTGLGVQKGSGQLAPSEKLTWAVGVLQVLKNNGVEPDSINIDAQSFKNIEVILSYDGPPAPVPEEGALPAPKPQVRLIFSTEEDVTRSGLSASRVIKHLTSSREGGLTGLAYIDIRTPERIVYK